MSIADIRTNNYIQPNRMFQISGDVRSIEREPKITKVVLNVFSYFRDGRTDQITVWFKGVTKQIVDNMVAPHIAMHVMGDIVVKDGQIFFDGKIIEIYKGFEIPIFNSVKSVKPDEVNYNPSF